MQGRHLLVDDLLVHWFPLPKLSNDCGGTQANAARPVLNKHWVFTGKEHPGRCRWHNQRPRVFPCLLFPREAGRCSRSLNDRALLTKVTSLEIWVYIFYSSSILSGKSLRQSLANIQRPSVSADTFPFCYCSAFAERWGVRIRVWVWHFDGWTGCYGWDTDSFVYVRNLVLWVSLSQCVYQYFCGIACMYVVKLR